MKILIHGVNYAPELTGIGKYTSEMGEWLTARGHAVKVVTAPPYYPSWHIEDGYSGLRYAHERVGSVDIWRTPIWVPSEQSGKKRLLHLGSYAASSFPVVVGQCVWRPDVVLAVAPTLFCAPGAWLAARLCGAKAWLHVQDFEIDAAFELGLLSSPAARRIVERCERWLMRRFDVVSSISNKMVEKLATKGVAADHAILFPNWVDTQFIFPLPDARSVREEWDVPPDVAVALYSGNMGEKQGLEVVVESARALQHDSSILFVICGDGAAYTRLRMLAEGLNNIRWLPLQPVEKLNSLLNLADVHLLPQRAGASDLVMPSKLTGMFASGRPVIATAVRGTQLYETVQGRGLTVEPGDAGEMTKAILELLGNSALRGQLGRAARDYAVKHWARDPVLSRFEKKLLEVSGQTPMAVGAEEEA